MAVFERHIKTALRLIGKYGQIVTIKQTQGSVENPDKPWESIDLPPLIEDVKMVFIPSTYSNSELLSYLKGQSVPTGSVVGLMGIWPITPKLSDVVIRDGKELIIKAVDTLKPNNEPIMHTIEFEL